VIFGSLGMAYLVYGKKAGRLVPIGAGLGLLIIPYFIANVTALLIVCLVFTAVPFFLKDL
jgi:hypothetical protein